MDYKKATVAELADYVEISPPSRITQQLIYYTKAGNTGLVDKIKAARLEVKRRKLKRLLDAIQ